MQLHLAGLYANGLYPGNDRFDRVDDYAKQHRLDVPWLLESYHYFNKPKQIARLRANNEKVFLDSGAFSSWTKGAVIDLPQYCRFAQEYADCFTVVSVLDVIGSDEGTWHNQQAMEKLGVRPIPCFHYGDDLKYLERYVANYDHLAIAGVGLAGNRANFNRWMDEVWGKYLTDSAGRARVRVHGFAITAMDAMVRYPWYSVDSSTWARIGALGGVMHPDIGVISMSDKSPDRKVAGQHFDNYSPPEREALRAHFASLGYPAETLQKHHDYRWTYNCWSFSEVNRRINRENKTFIRPQETFF